MAAHHKQTKCHLYTRNYLCTFLDNNIRKLPHPKLVLQFIRQTRIIELMEPPEEAVGLGRAEDDAGNQDEDRAEPKE